MENSKLTATTVISIERPKTQCVPLVISSPHSGRSYPREFVRMSALTSKRLRSSEDSFVNELFQEAKNIGAPLIRALFPRVFVDVNRGPYELDPEMFKTPLPDYVVTKNSRIAAGLGTIAKVVSNGDLVYREKLNFNEATDRINSYYYPYHEALQALIQDTKKKFGFCILLDCHSMPSSVAKPALCQSHRSRRLDIVLGDCHGTSCDPSIITTAMEQLLKNGFSLRRNNPYAGGFITRNYGKPRENVHSLQIEINRALYMDEKKMKRLESIISLTNNMSDFMLKMAQIPDPALAFQQAAE
ncbi:MAG: N-formylglutamate amidohydrolase [Rhodospirillaceae bacterium]|nr:N-formylglutamate amidohydrolase [Rhodospirillaceae bacterium]